MKDSKHSESNNAFVRREESKLKGMMGSRPKMKNEMKEFNAYMSNDGKSAEMAGKKLCAGMENAYPANFNSAVDKP